MPLIDRVGHQQNLCLNDGSIPARHARLLLRPPVLCEAIVPPVSDGTE